MTKEIPMSKWQRIALTATLIAATAGGVAFAGAAANAARSPDAAGVSK
jgi:hypothetical protein